MKVVSTTFQIVTTLCLMAIGGIFIASMLPIPGGIQSKIVQSGSMSPHIPVGALVVIKPTANYQVGDVITFSTSGAVPTTHRIVAIEGSGEKATYTTKGDANEDPDANQTSRQSVIGKVVLALPYVGYVLAFARKPLGFALLIGLPALMVIVEESWTLWTQFRAKRRAKPKAKAPPVMMGDIRRLRVSDDMFIYIAPLPQAPQTRGVPAAAVSLCLLAVVFGMGRIGHTFSYFSDSEYSVGNTLAAGSWSTDVAPQPFTIQVDSEASSTDTVTIPDVDTQEGTTTDADATSTPPEG